MVSVLTNHYSIPANTLNAKMAEKDLYNFPCFSKVLPHEVEVGAKMGDLMEAGVQNR